MIDLLNFLLIFPENIGLEKESKLSVQISDNDDEETYTCEHCDSTYSIEDIDDEVCPVCGQTLEDYVDLVLSWKDRIENEISTYEQWLDEVVRPFRDHLINEADLIYCNCERWSQYTDEEKLIWIEYKQKLRDFTEIQHEVVDKPKDLDWPEIPVKKVLDTEDKEK